MGFLEDLLFKVKFSQREFELCKISLERLFKEEIQAHKRKKFIEVVLTFDNRVIIVETSKFKINFDKKIAKGSKINLKSDVELYNISKHNIEKNSTRIRWIIETVDKVIKLYNSSLSKVELFSKVYGNIILEDLRKFGVVLQSVIDKDYLYLYNNEFNFELKNNGYYDFKIDTSTSSSVTKEKLDKINKTRDVVLRYWKNF